MIFLLLDCFHTLLSKCPKGRFVALRFICNAQICSTFETSLLFVVNVVYVCDTILAKFLGSLPFDYN